MVRKVREQEAWVERVDSLRIRAVRDWEWTPKGLRAPSSPVGGAVTRQQAGEPPRPPPPPQVDHRSGVRPDPHQAPGKKMAGSEDDLRIWDGKHLVLQNRYSYADWPDLRPDLDGTLINREPERWLYWLVWTNFDCFRAGPHVFWWHGPKSAPRSSGWRPCPRISPARPGRLPRLRVPRREPLGFLDEPLRRRR